MPNRFPFYVLDAFTDRPFNGNPAGVFFDLDGALSAEEMRRFAGEVSLESAFVLPADSAETGADYRLRYFTGVTEVPFCGHATVAAAVALAKSGCLGENCQARFATSAGIVPVSLKRGHNGTALVTIQQHPKFKGEPLSIAVADDITAALGGDPSSLEVTGLSMQVYSTGTPWLFAPIRDLAFIETIVPDEASIASLSRRFKAFGVYAFALQREEGGGLAVRSRCFAPAAGLDEDPVTGSASGALGWYLYEHGLLLPDETLVAHQGNMKGRNGIVRIVARNGGDAGVSAVEVCGTAVLVAEGSFLLKQG